MNNTIENPAAPAAIAPAPDTFERCFYLGDYEDNGYHDSYFHVVYWDDRTGERKNVQYAATAYGGGWDYTAVLAKDISADVAARIQADTHARALASLIAQETARVMQPTPAQMPFGTRIRITKDSRKGCKTPYRAGEVGEVSGQYWFGTFYAKGYNTKGRSNGRAGVRMADGRTVFVAMNLCRLDCEPDFDRVAREAEGAKMRCPHAWWTRCNPMFAE